MLTKPISRASALHSRGVTMIEVLVAMLILTVGLLSVAGLQARMQIAELEAYQRAQAIVLLQDMVDRINANRRKAAIDEYVTATVTLGTGSTLDCSDPGTNVALKDKCEWSNTLLGAAETTGGGASKLGAMNGARGCITNPVTTMPREVVVALVWQGIAPTLAPSSTTCGTTLYGDEKTRRAMVAHIKIGCLQNNPTTGACLTP